MKTKAIAYLRVSSSGQCDGDGLTRQLEACRKYAASNDMEIVQVFEERGVSGTKEERAALAEMMLALEENGHGAKTVIIERLDRLSRDLLIQEGIVRDLKRGGFHLTSALEGPELLSDDPTRKLIRQIFGALAEYDKSMLVAKLGAARSRIRASGRKCDGQKGYAETDPEMLERLRKLRFKGYSFPDIAEMWNHASDAPRTKTGAPWRASNLAKIHRHYNQ